jgi:hypothetical protein
VQICIGRELIDRELDERILSFCPFYSVRTEYKQMKPTASTYVISRGVISNSQEEAKKCISSSKNSSNVIEAISYKVES